ncbi:hypothetical protein ACLOJK_025813 [Asimina triloba]
MAAEPTTDGHHLPAAILHAHGTTSRTGDVEQKTQPSTNSLLASPSPAVVRRSQRGSKPRSQSETYLLPASDCSSSPPKHQRTTIGSRSADVRTPAATIQPSTRRLLQPPILPAPSRPRLHHEPIAASSSHHITPTSHRQRFPDPMLAAQSIDSVHAPSRQPPKSNGQVPSSSTPKQSSISPSLPNDAIQRFFGQQLARSTYQQHHAHEPASMPHRQQPMATIQ